MREELETDLFGVMKKNKVQMYIRLDLEVQVLSFKAGNNYEVIAKGLLSSFF